MAVICDDLVQLEAPPRSGRPHNDGGRRLRWLLGASTLVMLAAWLIPEGTGTSPRDRAEPARTLQDQAARQMDRGRPRLLSLVAPQGMAVARVGWKEDGTGFVDGTALPALAKARTYQLWALAGSQRVSVGVLGPRPGIVAFSAQVANLRGFSLTEEAASGVASSARTPVAYGHLPPPR